MGQESKIIGEDNLGGVITDLGDYILDTIYENSLILGEEVAVPSLKEAVQERIYDAYSPEDYTRTNTLKESIEPFGDKMVSTSQSKRRKKSVKFGAYFDTSDLYHFSLLTKSKKPERTWGVPLWANQGWSWVKGMKFEDIRHPTAPPRKPAPDYLTYGSMKMISGEKLQNSIKALFGQ